MTFIEHHCVAQDLFDRWQFCEHCGRKLEIESQSTFDRDTGTPVTPKVRFKSCALNHQRLQLWDDNQLPPPPPVYNGQP